jgi:hypothetical protein
MRRSTQTGPLRWFELPAFVTPIPMLLDISLGVSVREAQRLAHERAPYLAIVSASPSAGQYGSRRARERAVSSSSVRYFRDSLPSLAPNRAAKKNEARIQPQISQTLMKKRSGNRATERGGG